MPYLLEESRHRFTKYLSNSTYTNTKISKDRCMYIKDVREKLKKDLIKVTELRTTVFRIFSMGSCLLISKVD